MSKFTCILARMPYVFASFHLCHPFHPCHICTFFTCVTLLSWWQLYYLLLLCIIFHFHRTLVTTTTSTLFGGDSSSCLVLQAMTSLVFVPSSGTLSHIMICSASNRNTHDTSSSGRSSSSGVVIQIKWLISIVLLVFSTCNGSSSSRGMIITIGSRKRSGCQEVVVVVVVGRANMRMNFGMCVRTCVLHRYASVNLHSKIQIRRIYDHSCPLLFLLARWKNNVTQSTCWSFLRAAYLQRHPCQVHGGGSARQRF